jgi:hypothetical protein
MTLIYLTLLKTYYLLLKIYKHAVGFNILGGFGKEIAGSDSAGYIAKLNTVKSLLTLPNLGLLKGAMSDNDLKFITSAGTSLNNNISEATFTKTLDSIINKYETAVRKQNAIQPILNQQTSNPVDSTLSEFGL